MLVLLALLLTCGSAARAQGRPRITGLDHVVFYAEDTARSRAFYDGLIGWVTEPASGDPAKLRFYLNHRQYVEVEAPPTKGQPDRLGLVAFATDDAEGLRRLLASKGVSVPDKVTDAPDGSHNILVHDPEGNPIEFTQAGADALPRPAAEVLARRLSTHLLHAGYQVHSRAAMDRFYKDILGFHLYWQGGAKPGAVDWVMMQVPDGTDWIEYMLYLGNHPTRAALGSANHIAPGVDSVAELQHRLEEKGWQAKPGTDPKVFGADGKLQLDLSDPDGTRIEFMEFLPVKAPCCSPYTGRQPVNETGW